jgi:hypothetical protein
MATKRPHDVAQLSDKIIPSVCMILENLEKVYTARAQEDSDDDDFEEIDGDIEDTYSEEEDEDDKKTTKSKSMNGIENALSKSAENGKVDDGEDSDSDDYSDDDYDEYDKTLLENYNTCIDSNDEVDEFVIFKDTLQSLQTNEPQFYELITTSLTPDQCKLIQNFITTANRRLAEKESRKILASGGYSFTNFNVPQQFNFGMDSPNPNAFATP